MMTDATIRRVHGRRIWDSRGRPTVEVEVHTAGGAVGRAAAPAGASRGSREAIDLRDGGSRLAGMDVQRAVANVKGPIAHALVGLDARRQESVDHAMLAADGTADKSKLGGNAIVAASLACAHAAAAAEHVPLWRYIAGNAAVRLPLPEIQIFGGGAHAGRRIDIQDLMIEMVVNLLKHKNPYTQATYAKDPALSYIEIHNEDDIFFFTSSGALNGCSSRSARWPPPSRR